MSSQNGSFKVTTFIIGGFESTKQPVLVGVAILITYLVVVIANTMNILFIIYDERLHKPMYLLIFNLAVVDILYTTSVSPTMIGVLLANVNTISYMPCMIQMFIYNVAVVLEMFALAVMAFDRLIAVSYPFQYHTYLTNMRTFVLVCILWVAACGFVAVMPATALPLLHCHTKLIYGFCDYAAVIRTTCVDLTHYFIIISTLSFFLLFFTFSLICLSYCAIIYFVKLASNEEKRKMGSTCLSHLIVVVCFYFPLFIRIVLTRSGIAFTQEELHGLTIGAVLGPSFVNPFVYCLRIKEIRHRILKTVHFILSSMGPEP